MNDAAGRLTIEALPPTYAPNHDYPLAVMLTRPNLQMAGFQLAVRSLDGRRQAGSLEPADDRTAVISLTPRRTSHVVQYLQHSRKGVGLTAQDTARWTFMWRAPAGLGPVVFHIAANAANGDDSPLDDFIYTREFVLNSAP